LKLNNLSLYTLEDLYFFKKNIIFYMNPITLSFSSSNPVAKIKIFKKILPVIKKVLPIAQKIVTITGVLVS
jgi:hypothetical protein